MQLEYPLTNHMKGNIVLTQEKTAIAYYRVRSETVMLTDVEKKLKTKRKVTRALNRLKLTFCQLMPTFEEKWVLCVL